MHGNVIIFAYKLSDSCKTLPGSRESKEKEEDL